MDVTEKKTINRGKIKKDISDFFDMYRGSFFARSTSRAVCEMAMTDLVAAIFKKTVIGTVDVIMTEHEDVVALYLNYGGRLFNPLIDGSVNFQNPILKHYVSKSGYSCVDGVNVFEVELRLLKR